MAGEVTKVLYVVVIEDDETREERKESSLFRYTRPVLQSTLQLMGCKPQHALKISGTVFKKKIRSDELVSADRDLSREDDSKGLLPDEASNYIDTCLDKVDDKSKSKPCELYKKRTTIVVRRKTFLDVVCDALTEYKYMGPNQRDDLALACRIRERKESVTVLLCGTSGCGKSTLSALLGSRLGITTVVSTDSIRHMTRRFVDENQNPLLWASTYHAGEYLDPVAVAEAKEKRKAKKLSGISTPPLRKQDGVNGVTAGKSPLDGISSVIDVHYNIRHI